MTGTRNQQLIYFVFLAFLTLQCFVNSLDISIYPTVGQDEVMLNDPARELARNGVLRTTVFGSLFDFERVYLFQPFGQALVMAAVYKVFGFGLLQTRLPAVLLAGVCAWLLYFWVYRMSGSRAGGYVAACLLALNLGFMTTSRLGRMDVFCILLVLAGLICLTGFLMAPAPRFLHLALAALSLGAAALMHLNSLEYLAATVLILLTLRGVAWSRRLRYTLAFGALAALPLLSWLTFAWLHGPDTFKHQFLEVAATRTAGESGFIARVPAEITRQLVEYSRTPLILLLMIAGVAWLYRQDAGASPMFRPLKILVAVAYLFNTFVMGKISGFYYLYPSLMAAAAAGMMASSLFAKPPGRARLAFQLALLLLVLNGLAAIYGPRYLAWRYQRTARSYQALERDLLAFNFAGKTVLGSGPEWYALEKTGAHFRIPFFGFVRPDAKQQDYVLVNTRDLGEVGPFLDNFYKTSETGNEFPLVFGSKLTDRDYHLVVFRSNKRHH